MKIIKINQKCSWGDRVELFDAKELKYFCYDHLPHCIDLDFKELDKYLLLDLEADYQFDLYQFERFLLSSSDEVFCFRADNTNKRDSDSDD